ncbi:MAG: polysaccharide biosynthesis/export family protein [Acidobacteriota bacterium]
MLHALKARSAATRGALLLVALAVVLSGCAAHNTPVDAPAASEARPLYDPGPIIEYRLVPADSLLVRFYGNEELDQAQPIRPDGKISLPYVGQVQAAGLTPAELEATLVDLYTGELAAPRINVIVQTHAPQQFFAGGEIGSQGVHLIHGEINVLQAVQMAGGLTPTARAGSVILIRADEEGRPTGRVFNVKRLQAGGGQAYNTMVRANDVIYVPRSKIVNFATWVDNYIGGLIPNLPGFGFVIGDAVND